MLTVYYNIEESELFQENNWIEDALLDLAIFKLAHKVWINQEQLWKKWVRS